MDIDIDADTCMCTHIYGRVPKPLYHGVAKLLNKFLYVPASSFTCVPASSVTFRRGFCQDRCFCFTFLYVPTRSLTFRPAFLNY